VGGVIISTSPSVLVRVTPSGPKWPSRATLSIIEVRPAEAPLRFLKAGSVKANGQVHCRGSVQSASHLPPFMPRRRRHLGQFGPRNASIWAI
jgi:hypothetical protein